MSSCFYFFTAGGSVEGSITWSNPPAPARARMCVHRPQWKVSSNSNKPHRTSKTPTCTRLLKFPTQMLCFIDLDGY